MASPRVVIIGAGAGGLTCGMALRKLRHENFTIYEKAEDVGGTWRYNIYPGCSSDITMPFYCLSTELRNWTASHLPQEEILDYWVDLAKKYNIYPHAVFNTLVVSAEWNKVTNLYDVITQDTRTNATTHSTAHIVISAVGILERPRFSYIPGLQTFKGDLFHSGRWDTSVQLSGKRVGVIGNGASATQFVPIISEDPTTQIVQFCRSANWVFPSLKKQYSGFRRGLFRFLPFFMYLTRWWQFIKFEALYASIFASPLLRWFMTKVTKKYMLSTAPKKYHQKLIPDYPMGCKRIIFDSNYLSALHRPNLDLNYDGIDTIVEDGILTKTGEHIQLDTLIFSTGYVTDSYPIAIKGRKGQTVQDYYDEQKGPKAYLGTCLPGFPNFFMIFGPNITTGHTSVVWTNELQVNYIMQLINPVLQKKVISIEVTEKATDDYDGMIQRRLSKSVFTQCHSWYRVGGTGKITNAFPEPARMFYLWFRRPNWNHYLGIGADSWLKSQRLHQRLRRVGQLALLASVIFGVYNFRLHGIDAPLHMKATLKEWVDWTKDIVGAYLAKA
ncbi:FAD/NAD(P)-binding domain-containing protein [Pholiota conissans]|uniref:FAD/NAD(P)-binding domain-containing protein n=1 Tax=Pholiota conissans TaxID=109636 RepID=A0A9P5YIX1_9AGAR|nr:FAD/NAD(P)-binding domain-containing protein [Pholiota conissans]